MVRIIVPSEDGSVREIEVEAELTLGRHPANDVVLAEPSVSSRHAAVSPSANGLTVRDLGSTNGTFVNGVRVTESAEVRPGDQVRLGNLVLEVQGEAAHEDSAEAYEEGATVIAPAIEAPAPEEPPLPWRIVVRAGNDLGAEAAIPPLGEGEIIVGRDASSGLVLTDARVSGRHASLRLTPAGLEVTDLGSANGTLVRRSRLEGTTHAQPGDEIQVGETVLVPVTGDEAAGYGPIPTIIELTPGASSFDASQLEEMVARKTRSNRMLIGLVAVFALAAVGISAALLLRGGGGDTSTEAAIVERNGPATVQILNLTDGGLQFSGTGSVIDRDEGLILTNNHVASGGELLVVANQAEEAVEAELVAAAICDDLALVRIVRERDRDDFGEVTMAAGSDIRQGDRVVALGYPSSAESAGGNRLDSLSATSGIVSKVNAVYDNPGSGLPLLENVIQHDAAVNPGNSGGPLFDSRGRQVGVNTAIFFGSRGRVEGANYAVSIQRVRELLDDMKEGVSPAWFGAAFEEGYDGTGAPVGLLVLGVTPGSEAAVLGFEGARNGDGGIEYRQLITEVNGTPVRNLSEYCDAMPRDRDEVVLTVVDGNSDVGFPVEVVVGER